MTFPQGPTDPPPTTPTPPPLPPPGSAGPAFPSAGPGSWQHLPPEQLQRLHQPGIVPLRPLHLSDIFGGALATMRRNPTATIGMALLVLTALLVPSALASLAIAEYVQAPATDRGALITLTGMVFSMIASVALTGMLVHVVGEAVLGDRVGLGETWRAVRGRLPALIGTMLLISLGLFLVVGLFLAAVIGLVVARGDASGPWLILALVLGMPLLTVVIVWAGCRLSLATSAVVLERVGPLRAIRRAWALSTGGQGWRIVGITLLAGLVTGIFSMMVQIPISTALFLGLGLGFDTLTPVHPAAILSDHLVQVIVGAFATPFTAGVTALLYLDQRIRREGLDLTLLRAAQARRERA
ncbi:hypothetical protein [Ornithinimicrobium sp. Y1694]|uniref:hypothetical protein n=1 Tax=Ornithinimicrobium sp. Y1694 TaxID=3418590 RepID=UPI003CEC6237